MEKTKPTITCSVFGKTGSVLNDDDTVKIYHGRLICVLDDEQFNSLITNPEMAKKIYTMESIPISLLARDLIAVDGKRIVITVNKKGDATKHLAITLVHKKLFVSEKIDFLSHYNRKEGEIGISCASTWINMEET